MKVFKNLTIFVPAARCPEFIDSLDRTLPAGWSRDKKAESRSLGLGSKGHVYIVCDKKGPRMSALVALVPKEGAGYYVSNIVPREAGQLTHDQYNAILDDFADHCISPVIAAMGLRMDRTSDSETLEHWISEDSAKKFKRFSGLANKSTGTAHPMDKERWYDFVIAIVTNSDSLDASSFARWLVEEDGWADDVASDIAIEYEQEVGLLNRYLGK